MTDEPRSPGPPDPPRCPECGVTAHLQRSRFHTDECSIGRANVEHWANVAAVEKAVNDYIAERRQDRPFMARLRQRITDDADFLRRLDDE